jgi:hypothetical protein
MFGASLALSAVFLFGLIFLILSSTVVMGLLPTLGIGGVYVEGETFFGNDGTVYPASNQYTDTPAETCDERPMLAIELQDAIIQGFTFRKDVKLPFIPNRWMSISIVQPSAGTGDSAVIDANTITLYTTQLEGQSLLIRNIDLREGASNDKFGPNSGELLLEGGANVEGSCQVGDTSGCGIEATDINGWVHAVTGDGVLFDSRSQDNAIEVDLSYPTTAEVRDYYEGTFSYNIPDSRGNSYDRNQYFSCVPEFTY